MSRPRSASPRAPSKTRERVLDTSLALFNELGAPNVTTNHIADAVGISPGNLYYHFRHKEDIVTGLYDRYEAALGEVIGSTEGGSGAADDLWLLVHLAFEVIHDFRFIHRDLSELSAAYPAVRARFKRGLEQGIEQTTQYCRALAEQGALDATPEEARALAINMSLVTTYWLNLQALRDGGRGRHPDSDSDAISLGVFQVLSLITPYLRGPIKDEFRRVAVRYLPAPPDVG
jgi:AcrR family transcriptional regulator